MATSMGPSKSIATTSGAHIPTNYGALSTLVIVFFFWGFIASGNSVFIPFCKHFFHLDQFQSQLVDFAFYTASAPSEEKTWLPNGVTKKV